MKNEEWRMKNEEWRMNNKNEEWRMKNEEWRMKNLGGSRMRDAVITGPCKNLEKALVKQGFARLVFDIQKTL